MAHVDIRSFTSVSPEPSRLNISIRVLTTRDYPWSKITSSSVSPVLLSREGWQILCLKPWCFNTTTSQTPFFSWILFHSPSQPCFILQWPFHANRFVSLRWLNSTIEFRATKWYRSEHFKLKLAGIAEESKLLQGSLTAKGETDKEGKGRLSHSCVLWFRLSVSGFLFAWVIRAGTIRSSLSSTRSCEPWLSLSWEHTVEIRAPVRSSAAIEPARRHGGQSHLACSSLSSLCWAQSWSHLSCPQHHPGEVEYQRDGKTR